MSSAHQEVLEALRHYATRYKESTHRLAAFTQLPMNDGAALGEILWAEDANEPLSAARLQWRVGLTSGATNALIKRLETAGLVTRTRESDDGRIVTLRATAEARQRIAPFLGRSQARLAAILAQYTDEELATVSRFLIEMADVLPQGAARGSGDGSGAKGEPGLPVATPT